MVISSRDLDGTQREFGHLAKVSPLYRLQGSQGNILGSHIWCVIICYLPQVHRGCIKLSKAIKSQLYLNPTCPHPKALSATSRNSWDISRDGNPNLPGQFQSLSTLSIGKFQLLSSLSLSWPSLSCSLSSCPCSWSRSQIPDSCQGVVQSHKSP